LLSPAAVLACMMLELCHISTPSITNSENI
jgi:hypothetical protein